MMGGEWMWEGWLLFLKNTSFYNDYFKYVLIILAFYSIFKSTIH